jgi:hypothetical protein
MDTDNMLSMKRRLVKAIPVMHRSSPRADMRVNFRPN